MGSMSGGAPALPTMPDFNSPSHLSSPVDMKHHLQALLDSKEKQLEQAATLGQQVLAQRLELEQRVAALQDTISDRGDEEELDSETRRRYRELADTIRDWDTHNAEASNTFSGSSISTTTNGTQPSPSPHLQDLPREDTERPKPSSSAAQSRRAKNAAHRADDVEFAFEIGSGLLTEVRRLQSLLAERDKAIQDMKEEKDDLEKSVEALRRELRQQEQSSDKYKEENWNLEVTLQELRTQLSDSQATALRLEGDTKRLNKQLATSHDTTEHQKNELERLQTTVTEMKAKHETDIAQARKHAAGLQRDKSDLQQAMESLKAENNRVARKLPRFGSPLTPNGATTDFLTPGDNNEDDVFSVGGASTNRRKPDGSSLYPHDRFSEYADSSPDASPIKAPSHPSNEIEALQQRLAHAQRQINTLKGTLQREKEQKMDYRRKLESSPGFGPGDEDDLEPDENDETAIAKPRRPTPYRVGASRVRGRGRGGLTLVQRLGMSTSSPSSEYNDDDHDFSGSPPPPIPPIPINFQVDEFDADVQEEQIPEIRSQSPSPFDAPSNRTSVDGMDPAFANILRRSPSVGSIPHNGSPLRQSVAPRSGTLGRRSRGGAAYQEARPPSLVGQPDVLAAELGFGGSPMKGHDSIYEEVQPDTSEIGCQTDDVPTPEPPPIHVTPATTDMAVQAEPEVQQPVVQPLPSTSECSIQTEDPPTSAYSEVAIQHSREEAVPVMLSTGMATDPIPVPAMASAEVQAGAASTSDVTTQTLQPSTPSRVHADTQTTEPIRAPPLEADISTSSDDRTVTLTHAPIGLYEGSGDEDGNETETGQETDFTDARQSFLRSTPSQSVDDFYSIQTMTDNDYSDGDDDDDMSIRTSTLPSRRANASVASSLAPPVSQPVSPSPVTPPAPPKVYDSKAISAEIAEPEAVVEPKPETREISIQTDEWVPPRSSVPFTSSVPPSPAAFRIATGQQFQFIPAGTSTRTASTTSTNGLAPSLFRDSPVARSKTLPTDRRQSMDSIVSSLMEDNVISPPTVDKSKPPMMALPPPPRAPPPPGSMPPPSFIPERRIPFVSSHDAPPPRPSSPPPPELIQRATTPTFGAVLSIPSVKGVYQRQHGSSMPPSQQGLRQLPSTHSFRSAANAASHAGAMLNGKEPGRREMSTTSLGSEGTPRSSISSDRNVYMPRNLPMPPDTPDRTANATIGPHGTASKLSTDPAVIHAITQTMIGEFLYKYTRRTMGGNSRHKRFFWVHPYTKTLYWSDSDPGSFKVSESSAKSTYIEGVRSVLDPNPMPPGLYQYSVVVSTPQREMKFTAPSKERHDIWVNALRYLLNRNSPNPAGGSPANTTIMPQSPRSFQSALEEDNHLNPDSSPQSQRSARPSGLREAWNTTPRGGRSRSQVSARGSMGKRSGTPALEYLRWNGPESPYSPSKSFEHVDAQNGEDLDFELHGDNMSDGFEGLDNVRACCDGRHTVGGHHHHHHPVPGDPPPQESLRLHPSESARPVSPSAWSFRSRSGSTSAQSKDGVGSMFSWGRAEGKLRFGSKRSAKTLPMNDD